MMKQRLKPVMRCLVILQLLAFAGAASAQMVLDQAIVIFDDPKQVKQDVTVTNESADERLFVSVEPFVVENPGTPEQELVSLKGSDSPSFLATPDKLIVEPGSSSIVRLMNLQPGASDERVYRVNFLPIKKPPELESEATDEIVPVVEIVVAYQVLSIVLPPDAKAEPTVTRAGKVLTLANNGNANFLLSTGQQCDPADPESCVDLPTTRVYAGRQATINLPFDAPASFTMKTPAGFSELVTP